MAFIFNNSNFILPLIVSLSLVSCIPFVYSLSTVSISETSDQPLICAITKPPNQPVSLNCTSFPQETSFPVNTSFSGIVAGKGFFCALRPPSSSSTSIMRCWRFSTDGPVSSKCIYRGPALKELAAGNSHICGLVNETSRLECWQWRGFRPRIDHNFSRIAVGENFVCGLSQIGKITCFGSNSANQVVGNYSVVSAGFRHACAIYSDNSSLYCWGVMVGEKPRGEFTSLALGENRSCALKLDGRIVCWGEQNFSLPENLQETYFKAIEAKSSVFCGVASSDSLYCWGDNTLDSNFPVFEHVLPGPCRSRSECPCGPLGGSSIICGQQMICRPCPRRASPPPPLTSSPWAPSPQPGEETGSTGWDDKMVAFLVVGCVGSSALLLVCCFFLFRYCKGKGCRVHDSGRLDETGTAAEAEDRPAAPPPGPAVPAPVLEKRLSHLISLGNGGGQLEEFSLQTLLEATNNFSEDHKIGTGSFGSVYHATLDDGREVAIKRAEISMSSTTSPYATKREDDKDNAFLNELESLSRLHHKNLVRLYGFCEDSNERVLVYEYVHNGTLNDHLHRLQSSPLVSWAARIKVALDAARGIEYLHVYAVPPIIHRDIKSSNILLDATWTAKVSDFGLSLMGPVDEESHLSLRAAGTVGYMDPEYYRLQKLTTKSDVYSFGVVLLEMLSGYKAIHRNENRVPRNVVDFVVPYIAQDEIHRVLDPKVPPPTPFEIEAVAYVGYLAADCVKLEGRDRPSMTEIVSILERALAACLAHPALSRSTTGSST
ncbi:serine/threonine-protein kinase-like protein CCR4 [Juglans microcarpa x Juglans regia]|uniref:serine/threonine-protein kinase-like protein CCR4 n=1 Tax=Juglans microcarpa x Juglans regia TaxID=2249226 RepID=UPI001B7DC753|nr:serine/threonine-protein kinase-like protein CCR4 [Juglans microcarpa x Juglans regia]